MKINFACGRTITMNILVPNSAVTPVLRASLLLAFTYLLIEAMIF